MKKTVLLLISSIFLFSCEKDLDQEVPALNNVSIEEQNVSKSLFGANTLWFYEDNGTGEIYDFKSDGTLNHRIYKATGWSEDWSIIKKFWVNNAPFVLFYDGDHGYAEIYSIYPSNGKINRLVKRYTSWAKGSSEWTTIEPYNVGGKTYLLFHNKKRKGQIYSINQLGVMTDVYSTGGWSDDWSIIKKFDVDNSPFMLFYDNIHGYAEIYSVDNATGKLKNLVKKYTSLAGGHFTFNSEWNAIETYTVGGKTYFLFYDNAGVGEIYSINVQGEMNRVYRTTGWSDDWDILKTYKVNNIQYVLFYESPTWIWNDGYAEIYSIDSSTGKLRSLVKKYTSWNPDWDIIE